MVSKETKKNKEKCIKDFRNMINNNKEPAQSVVCLSSLIALLLNTSFLATCIFLPLFAFSSALMLRLNEVTGQAWRTLPSTAGDQLTH